MGCFISRPSYLLPFSFLSARALCTSTPCTSKHAFCVAVPCTGPVPCFVGDLAVMNIHMQGKAVMTSDRLHRHLRPDKVPKAASHATPLPRCRTCPGLLSRTHRGCRRAAAPQGRREPQGCLSVEGSANQAAHRWGTHSKEQVHKAHVQGDQSLRRNGSMSKRYMSSPQGQSNRSFGWRRGSG